MNYIVTSEVVSTELTNKRIHLASLDKVPDWLLEDNVNQNESKKDGDEKKKNKQRKPFINYHNEHIGELIPYNIVFSHDGSSLTEHGKWAYRLVVVKSEYSGGNGVSRLLDWNNEEDREKIDKIIINDYGIKDYFVCVDAEDIQNAKHLGFF